MVVGEVPEAVDLLIAGAGPAGYSAALRASQLGRKVILVDPLGPQGVGGTCLRLACIPSRAWYGLAAEVGSAQTNRGRGMTGEVGADLEAIRAHIAAVGSELRGGLTSLLAGAQVDIFEGTVNLTRNDQAAIAPSRGAASFVEFKDVIFATGSTPRVVDEIPHDGHKVLHPWDLYGLERLPASAIVVGAGAFGAEAATALARFGVVVSLVEAQERVLPKFDVALSRAVTSGLQRLGVRVLAGRKAAAWDGETLTAVGTDEELAIAGEVIILASGRDPNTRDLGLETAGIDLTQDGHIRVDDAYHAAGNIFAAGDVTQRGGRANDALAQGIVAADSASGSYATYAPIARPLAVATEPEIATAGLSLEEARAQGLEVRRVQLPVKALGAAVSRGEKRGWCALVFEAGSGALLGAQLAGPRAADTIGQAVVAIEMGATVEDLALIFQAHPSMSEQFTEAALLATGSPIHAAQPGRTRAPNLSSEG